MAFGSWLELFSGAPGLEGPFLLEHRRAYSVIDRCSTSPRIVLAIGNEDKRRFVKTIFPDSTPLSGIAIRQLSRSVIFIDCNMHNMEKLQRVKAGPLSGDLTRHRLQTSLHQEPSPREIARFAFDLYWRMLAPLASVVLLFLQDLGGQPYVIDSLTEWARWSSRNQVESPPRVLVLSNDGSKLTDEILNTRIQVRLNGLLRRLDPTTEATAASVESQYRKAFESVRVVPMTNISETVFTHSEELFILRQRAGLVFAREHLKSLLQQAVYGFGQNTRRNFDVYYACRSRNPVPIDLAKHLINFLQSSHSIDAIPMITSALELNAHPPGMHC